MQANIFQLNMHDRPASVFLEFKPRVQIRFLHTVSNEDHIEYTSLTFFYEWFPHVLEIFLLFVQTNSLTSF